MDYFFQHEVPLKDHFRQLFFYTKLPVQSSPFIKNLGIWTDPPRLVGTRTWRETILRCRINVYSAPQSSFTLDSPVCIFVRRFYPSYVLFVYWRIYLHWIRDLPKIIVAYCFSSNLVRPLFSADFERNNFSIFLFSADRCPVCTKCLRIDLNVGVLMCFDCFNRSNLLRYFLK